MLSMAALATEFAECEADVVPQDAASCASVAGSCLLTHSSTAGSEDSSMGAII